MNQDITSFYVINRNSKTVAFGSNLTDLLRSFRKIEPNIKSNQYFRREFIRSGEKKMFTETINKKKYIFQRLL